MSTVGAIVPTGVSFSTRFRSASSEHLAPFLVGNLEYASLQAFTTSFSEIGSFGTNRLAPSLASFKMDSISLLLAASRTAASCTSFTLRTAMLASGKIFQNSSSVTNFFMSYPPFFIRSHPAAEGAGLFHSEHGNHPSPPCRYGRKTTFPVLWKRKAPAQALPEQYRDIAPLKSGSSW